MSTDYEKAYFERGMFAAYAWMVTRKRSEQLSDTVVDHAWDHRDEGMGPTECLPVISATPRTDAGEVERLREALERLISSADCLPKKTPAPGTNCTVHSFDIEAGTIWGLDLSVQHARAALAPSVGGEEWKPHLDYSGELMQPGEFRDPPIAAPSRAGDTA